MAGSMANHNETETAGAGAIQSSFPPRPPKVADRQFFSASRDIGASDTIPAIKGRSNEQMSSRLHAGLEAIPEDDHTKFDGYSINDLGKPVAYSLGASFRVSNGVDIDVMYEDEIPGAIKQGQSTDDAVNLRMAVRFW
jgi:hypothetical protein